MTFIFSLLLGTTMVMAQEIFIGDDLDRSDWEITMDVDGEYHGHTGFRDNAYQTEIEHILDGNKGSYWAIVKPGVSFKGGDGETYSTVAGTNPGFVIDMGSTQTFNCIRWAHRSATNPGGAATNNYGYLRVYAVDIWGSNDNTFTKINDELGDDVEDLVWIPNVNGYTGDGSTLDPNLYYIFIPEASYRYVKVVIRVWSNNYEGFHPNYPGNGSKNGNTMQIAEFGLGKYEPAGIKKTSASDVSIYPSLVKAGQAFNISLGNESSDATVAIYSIAGVKLSEQKISGSLNKQTIDEKGLYIIEVKKGTESFVSKVVVR